MGSVTRELSTVGEKTLTSSLLPVTNMPAATVGTNKHFSLDKGNSNIMGLGARSKNRVGSMTNWKREGSKELQAGEIVASFDIFTGPKVGNLGENKTFVSRFGGRDEKDP